MRVGTSRSGWERRFRRGPAGARSLRGIGRRHRPSVVVLAAGASSRFLRTKQLEELGGRTFVERVLDSIPTSEVSETVVVLGHDSERIARSIGARDGVRVVINAGFRSGIGGSIGAGVSALSDGTPGAVILLADQPFVTRSLLHRLIARFEAHRGRGIVAAVRGHLVTPPVIFARRYFPELEALGGDQGARSVIEKHADQLSLVRVRSRMTLKDIDTQGELEAAKSLWLLEGGEPR